MTEAIPTPAPGPWFARARTLLFDDAEDGQVYAAYVELRHGKATRFEQPDRMHPVIFHLGADGLPNGVKMFEPVPGRLKALLCSRFVTRVPAMAGGGREDGRVPPAVTDALVDSLLSEIDRAGARLPRRA